MRRWPRNVLLVALAVGITLGLLIWAKADSGTKAVDLGAGLVATGAFGGILVFLERELSHRIGRATEDIQAISPVGDPLPDSGRAVTTAQLSSGRPRSFSAEFVGWMRDENRIDASQVRLRVLCDGEYFQFFTGVVSGPALRMAIHGSEQMGLDQYKRGCIYAAVSGIQLLVEEGFEPLDEPLNAVELLVDSDVAERRARLEPNEPIEDGAAVGTWVG